ncbi:hypothetical protein PVAP13_9NG357100 [Panicum virgatum]|uniref:FAD-binding domain-containing protein n=1 Tax=Panicum virgatum TaxID=38727 RepID=A0A8T0MMY3_PANVG|nr:hypothetical protein PVAP13_9NG357100 [Panicum virgatum]
MEEIHGIVIVGGGICGLATARALHGKGISSLVLEKYETLRIDGVAIGIHTNGWRALEQLGIAAELRDTATLITEYHNVWQKDNKSTHIPVSGMDPTDPKRKDLVEALAKNLPAGTIRFGCGIEAIVADSADGHCTVLSTADSNTIKAKVLIGCDGANSVVARYLGLGNPSYLPRLVTLGLTSYPNGHPFGPQFLRFAGDDFAIGRLPVSENLVHFFVSRPSPSTAGFHDEGAAQEYVLEKLPEFPAEIAEMVRRCEPGRESLKTLTRVWYRPPWQMLLGRFQRGAVTVAGDAMHVMGPFVGQGGSAALEDAVVLARALSRAVPPGWGGTGDAAGTSGDHDKRRISVALGRYVGERRARLVMLSLESFLIGTWVTTKSLVKRLVCVAILALLGSHSRRNANYDCGRL